MSALIFAALAVAWAVYLIPQALKHHEAGDASRTVEGFSDRLRVLARREPVDRKTARLVVTPGRPASSVEASVEVELDVDVEVRAGKPRQRGGRTVVKGTGPVPQPIPEALPAIRARRAAAKAAARRRRRVLGTLILALVAVAVGVALSYVAPVWLAVPGGLLVVWLVACRLMVRREMAVLSRSRPICEGEPVGPLLGNPDLVVADPESDTPVTEEIAAVSAEVAEEPAYEPAPVPGSWTPVAEVLPTYVDKAPAARRTVRTIDLESTGVWTSGRTAGDAALAREADEARRAARGQAPDAARKPGSADERRASGS